MPIDPVHQIYSDHRGWLNGWLSRRLGRSPDVPDLVHDVFVRLMRSGQAPTLREPRAFLTTVAHGLLINHWRRRDIERAYLAALATQPEALQPSPEARSLVIEALQEVDAALSALSARARRAFLMAQLEGHTYSEIATVLGVSDRMVRKYMAQAMLACIHLQARQEAV